MTSNAEGRSDSKNPARRYAWMRVKTAIRAYSFDPSRRNAEEVEAAWERMRRIDAVLHWRELQGAVPGHSLHR